MSGMVILFKFIDGMIFVWVLFEFVVSNDVFVISNGVMLIEYCV